MTEPTPTPPGINWAALRAFFASLSIKRAAGGTWAAIKASVQPVAYTLVMTAAILYLSTWFQGCTLPPVPWPTPTPQPVTALEKAIADAYAAESDPQKAQHVAALAAALEPSVVKARASGATTAGALFASIKADAVAATGGGKLPNIDRAIASYLNTKLPTVATTVMTPETWMQAENEMAIVVAALRKVK